MATIFTGYRNYTRFYLSWDVVQQDIANNRSLVNWTAGIQGQPGITAYWYSNAVRLNSVYIDGQGNLAAGTWSNLTLRNGANIPLRSGSVWIGHNGDGTKGFGVSVSGWLYGNGDLSANGSMQAPTIPRNSQVTTNADNYTLGDPVVIYTNRKSSAFTHQITIRAFGGDGPVIRQFDNVTDAVTWYPSSGEITQMQNLIPTANSLTIWIWQHNWQVGQGSAAWKTFTLTNANPTFNDFTYRDKSSDTVEITGNDQVLVRGKSVLETTISAANKMVAVKGATPDRYLTTFDGVTEQSSYVATGDVVDEFPSVSTVGQATILATAFDSRNNNSSVSKQVMVYDYVAPTIETTLTRENNFGNNTTVHIEGKWDQLEIDGEAKNAITIGSLKYRYKVDGGSFTAWTTRSFTTTTDSWTITSDFILSLDNQKKYLFEFQIADKFGAVLSEDFVDVGKPIFFVGENSQKPVVSIGSMPAGNAPLTINGEDLLKAIYPVGAVYVSSSNTMSPLIASIGTWVRLKGRMIVGVDESKPEFYYADQTGGALTHRHKGYGDGDLINVQGLSSDNSGNGDLRATIGSAQSDASSINFQAIDPINPNTGNGMGNGTYAVNGSVTTNRAYSHYTKVVGYTSYHYSVGPYKAKYMWERTA